MIQWLTEHLYQPLANFKTSSLILFDGIIQTYLIVGLLTGIAFWAVYYWIINSELIGKKRWWILFGLVASLIVFSAVQLKTASMLSKGEIEVSNNLYPTSTDLAITNLFFFFVTLFTYCLISAWPWIRGHRLKRVPF